MSILISVIVPTFRRPRLLLRCLVALFAQDFDPSSYEIIIVEDAATDETQHLIEAWMRHVKHEGEASSIHRRRSSTLNAFTEWQDEDSARQLVNAASPRTPQTGSFLPPLPASGLEGLETNSLASGAEFEPLGAPCLRYIPLAQHRGPAAARNVGWRQAQGEFIAFTDDDCIPTPGWLRNGLAAFRASIVAVSGRVVMPLSGVPTDYELNASNLQRSEFVTANCFYRRSVLERTGGFDERFSEAWREDSDLIFTVMERIDGALQTAYAPDAVVIHPVRPAHWGISLWQQRKNMYNALLYKKHPALYRRRLGNVTPWRYYVIVIALLVCLVGLVAGHPIVALGAAMLWMALTGLFFLERLARTSRAPEHVAEIAITSILIPPVAIYWRARGALKYRVWFL